MGNSSSTFAYQGVNKNLDDPEYQCRLEGDKILITGRGKTRDVKFPIKDYVDFLVETEQIDSLVGFYDKKLANAVAVKISNYMFFSEVRSKRSYMFKDHFSLGYSSTPGINVQICDVLSKIFELNLESRVSYKVTKLLESYNLCRNTPYEDVMISLGSNKNDDLIKLNRDKDSLNILNVSLKNFLKFLTYTSIVQLSPEVKNSVYMILLSKMNYQLGYYPGKGYFFYYRGLDAAINDRLSKSIHHILVKISKNIDPSLFVDGNLSYITLLRDLRVYKNDKMDFEDFSLEEYLSG